jgi:hypothetical protein
MIFVLVKDAAEVTHVAQAIVPVAVIVPPVMGEVVAMLVTVPVGTAPPSVSRQFVEDTVQVNKCPFAGMAVGSCKLHDVCVAAGEPMILAVFAGRVGSVVLPTNEIIPG